MVFPSIGALVVLFNALPFWLLVTPAPAIVKIGDLVRIGPLRASGAQEVTGV